MVDHHITLCLVPTEPADAGRIPPTRIRTLNRDALLLERSILRFLAIASRTLSLVAKQSADVARSEWESALAVYLGSNHVSATR